MSPNLRRAAHQALDIMLDALAAEAEGDAAPKVKKRRGPTVRPLPAPVELSPELQAQLDRQLERAGYKKTA